MEKQNNAFTEEEIDIEQIKAFMALSAEEKLRRLEELNYFYQQAMPQKSKAVWEKLKEQGF
ncbi:MAG TPA: hypothetical protein VJL89_03835 [Thermodesulfovibrionia bacterium]|nr:hypothetical protein [Thermodesulfovibrionia bacterium]